MVFKAVPYFGVTGVTDNEQSVAIACATGILMGRIAMVGVLASATTVAGEAAGNPRRYPPREQLRSILGGWNDQLYAVHYNGPNDETLAAQLAELMHWAGPDCNGIQLNIAWPDPRAVHGLRISCKDIRIILQLSARALAEAGDDPKRVAGRVILEYGTDVDDVLLDPSGGKGLPLTTAMAVPYLAALEEAIDFSRCPINLGIAGGFGPSRMDVALELLEGWPHLNIDAESGLRSPDDELDLGKVSEYLTALCQSRCMLSGAR